MTNLDDGNDGPLAVDFVDDPVIALPHAVLIMPRELLTASGTGIVREIANSSSDAPSVRLPVDGFELFDRAGLDEDLKASHAS